MKRFFIGGLFLFMCYALNAETIVVTENQIANGLSVPSNELKKQTKELASYLNKNSYEQSSLTKECKNKQNLKKTLCDLVKALDAPKNDDGRKLSFDKSSKKTYLNAPEFINPETFAQAQRARPGELLDLLKKYSLEQIMSWLPKLISSKKCPQNLLIASLRMYEIGLPSTKAQASLEVGYNTASQCLAYDDPYFEVTHIRQGLLRHMWGERESAIKAFRNALMAKDAKDKDTTLFWLGFLQKNPKLREVYWNHLIEEFPLNFHSIHASRTMKQDPYSAILKKPFIFPQRKAPDSLAQIGIYWLESLYFFGEKKAATNLSVKLSGKLHAHFSKANLLYIAALADKYNLPSDAVKISSFIISEHPKTLSLQTLRYLHPRPFEKTFDRIEIIVDPLMTLSVAKQESGFNPLARSPANARGFLQILPSTAASYNVKSESYLYDLETNIEVGGKILSDLMKKQGRMDFALAAYNAGPHKVEAWKKRYETQDPMMFIDLIPYNETRKYVAKVLRNHYWYSALYDRNISSQ